MNTHLKKLLLLCILCLLGNAKVFPQETDSTLLKEISSLQQKVSDYEHRFDVLEKQIDDLLWFRRLEDIAHIDKVRLTSTPRWKAKDPEDRFAGNKLQFYT